MGDLSRFYRTPKQRDTTKMLLRERGVEVLEPLSQWEILRFRSVHGVCVVYRNSRERLTPNDEAELTLEAIEKQAQGSLAPVAVNRTSSGTKRGRQQMAAIIERDGAECFYCACKLTLGAPHLHPEQPTREHLVATSSGGPDVLANLFIACAPCNQEAGHMSAPEKIALRDRKRGHLTPPGASPPASYEETNQCL